MQQPSDDFWARELNEQQLEAVTYCSGPSLVIAGAGSGKTRVLTYKIAYLMRERHVSPYEILALTFTNKAAREMNDRIAQIVGQEDVRQLWSGTFHSIFARILRRECERIGFAPNFTIYDAADSKSLIKLIIRERGLDEKLYKPAFVQSRISEAKNRLIFPADYAGSSDLMNRDKAANVGELHRIYALYTERLHQANAMDFDDLLMHTFRLFRDNADVQERYRSRYRFILVDEYQDTNYAQHQIIRQLTLPDSCICVVGDDAQSIYAFRGANIDNILNFTRQYPTAKTIKLERNYRSTQNIVNAANSIIGHNRNQIPKTVYSEKEQGAPLWVMPCMSDREEAAKVVGEIRRLSRYEHVGLGEMAVLYRQNALSRSFEDELRKQGVPYRIYGGLSFYQRKEIKDVVAYFHLLVNEHDEEAFRRVVNYPTRGIGKGTVEALIATAHAHGASLWQVATEPERYQFNAGRTQAKLTQFCGLIAELKAMAAVRSAFEVAKQVVERSGIAADVHGSTDPEDLSRQENIDELLGSIRQLEEDALEQNGRRFVSIAEYLQQISLLTDADTQDDTSVSRVLLMTIHAAKGLEFNTVFVVGMEESVFPGSQSLFPRQMEEERRLFYVAVTRAKERCFLSFAKSRFHYGSMEYSEPSRFLRDVDAQYLQLKTAQGRSSVSSFSKDRVSADRSDGARPSAVRHTAPPAGFHALSPSPSKGEMPKNDSPFRAEPSPGATSFGESRVAGAGGTTPFAVGQRVQHDRFGRGIVSCVEGTGTDCRVTVDFEAVGSKKLLLKFARLTLL